MIREYRTLKRYHLPVNAITQPSFVSAALESLALRVEALENNLPRPRKNRRRV